MRTPSFWYQPRGALATFLSPLGWLYGAGDKLISLFKKPHRFSVPIISVGNIVSGGSGKTPTAIALAQLLQTHGYGVHFVTRGYGGREYGPLLVNPSSHQPLDVGDEPLLLAQHAPTWIAKKRAEGIEAAIQQGAQVIILDDGHQTKGIHKDISFVVVDLLQGFGNGCVLPAGPLRENLKRGLKRADAVITIGDSRHMLSLPIDKKIFNATMVPQSLKIPVNPVAAFCGLGFPEKFYKSLEDADFTLVATESFPDHYAYTHEDLLRLDKLAQKHQATLITTRKDFVKLPSMWQSRVHVFDIHVDFADPTAITRFICNPLRDID
jgi:tetraacyldisaccharide 4'-kinase